MSLQVSGTESDEPLERIFYALPYGIDEGLWAKPLGKDQYELRSIPLITPNLNFKDVVHIRASSVNGRHYIGEVVCRSGHKSYGIGFEDVDEPQMHEILNKLESMQVRYESSFEGEELFAIDIAPECDYIGICNYLKVLEQQKTLRLIGMDSK